MYPCTNTTHACTWRSGNSLWQWVLSLCRMDSWDWTLAVSQAWWTLLHMLRHLTALRGSYGNRTSNWGCAWWPLPVVPAPGRLRQVDCHTLKAKLRYSESPRLKTENNSNKTGTALQLGWQIACLAFMKTQVQSPALCKPDIVGTPITTELRRWDKRIKNIRSSLASHPKLKPVWTTWDQ